MNKVDFSKLERWAVLIHTPLLNSNSKFVGIFDNFKSECIFSRLLELNFHVSIAKTVD